MDNWRIERIPYDQFGHLQYPRVHGWGWLSPIGLITLMAAVTGLFINTKINDGLLAGMVLTGFIMIWIGIFLNGVSERKSMILVDANCLDIQVNQMGATMKRTANWAVRAHVEYEYNGKIYQSTPMPAGHAVFLSHKAVTKFSNYLLGEEKIKLYIDPKRPKRSLFYNLDGFSK